MAVLEGLGEADVGPLLALLFGDPLREEGSGRWRTWGYRDDAQYGACAA